MFLCDLVSEKALKSRAVQHPNVWLWDRNDSSVFGFTFWAPVINTFIEWERSICTLKHHMTSAWESIMMHYGTESVTLVCWRSKRTEGSESKARCPPHLDGSLKHKHSITDNNCSLHQAHSKHAYFLTNEHMSSSVEKFRSTYIKIKIKKKVCNDN